MPRISTIGRGSRVEPHTQYLDMFSVFAKLTPRFSLFVGLSYFDGADFSVSYSLCNAVAFTETNKKQQVHSISNHSGS